MAFVACDCVHAVVLITRRCTRVLVGTTRECVHAVVASACECVHLGELTAHRGTQVLIVITRAGTWMQ